MSQTTFLKEIKDRYGQNVEDDFNFFIRGDICLMVDYHGKGVCFIFVYHEELTICDGDDYFVQGFDDIKASIKWFLRTKKENRIRISLDDILRPIVHGIRNKEIRYKYLSVKEKSWIEYYWNEGAYLRSSYPIQYKGRKQVIVLGEKDTHVMCVLISKTIEKALIF